MAFCAVCKEHGEQSVAYFLPTWMMIRPTEGRPVRLSGGEPYCIFAHEMRINPFGDGKDRRQAAVEAVGSPPDLVPYSLIQTN